MHWVQRMPSPHLLRVLTQERRMAGKHLVQHTAQAVLIGPAIQLGVTGGLLRAHVVRSSDCETSFRELGSARLLDRASNAEIGNHRVPIR
jgi:hypothetical protein